jgi:hypothetical protein
VMHFLPSRSVLKLGSLAFGLTLLVATVFCLPAPIAAAQTQLVSVSPGYINLGMITNVSVMTQTSGSYTLVVQKPAGVEAQLPLTLTAGQVDTLAYGNASSGFEALVDQVGTYNVFLEQSGTVISSTSFYATNKLDVSMDMVAGGTCSYIAGADRGQKLIPRFYISYASTGGKITNSDTGISVSFSAPGNIVVKAGWDASASVFDAAVQPNWNYTYVGTWSPTVNVSDAAGNKGSYTYTGSPYVISPSALSTTIQLVDSKTNATITSAYSGENVTVYATISYPTNAEPVRGFVAPLDSLTRGGVVSGVVGYGTYNATTKSFTGKNSGTLATLALSYTGKNGIWVGSFTAGSLTVLGSSQTFTVVINSRDNASPPNVGTGILGVAPTSAQAITSSVTSSSSSPSSSSVPVWAYAGTTIALVIGVIVGFLARKK